MPRALWKGAITFGLVHIPVALYPASREEEVDFDWLDRRSMDPVGYKRINKRTGREIKREDIVKGVEYEPGHYVVLTDQEIRDAYPRTTRTIEIEAFVDAREIPLVYLEKPYYLAPTERGEKVYALLRESLRDAGRVGIARVVIQTKQHLAALMPEDEVLVLNTLRWASEIRARDGLGLPSLGRKTANLRPAELKMAAQLIDSMASNWDPGQYADRFHDAVMELVQRKVEAGDVEAVQPIEPLEGAPEADRSNVIDLTDLLRRSLGKGPQAARGRARTSAKNSGKVKAREPDEANENDEEAGSPKSGGSKARRGAAKSATAGKRASGAVRHRSARPASRRSSTGARSGGRRSA